MAISSLMKMQKKAFFPKKETFAMEADLDMGNHQIFNVKDPTVSDHGVNKKYVDAETATKFNQLTSSTNAKFATAQNKKETKRRIKAMSTQLSWNFLEEQWHPTLTPFSRFKQWASHQTLCRSKSSLPEWNSEKWVSLSHARREWKFFRIEYHG